MYDPFNDACTQPVQLNAYEERNRHTAIWSGNEIIIRGGSDTQSLNNGGLFNPDNNSWATLSLDNVPSARSFHSAIWTGTVEKKLKTHQSRQ